MSGFVVLDSSGNTNNNSLPSWFTELQSLAKEKLKNLPLPSQKLESWRKVRFSNFNPNEYINTESSLKIKIHSENSSIKLKSPADISNVELLNFIKHSCNNILNSSDYYKLFSLAYTNSSYILDIPENYSSKDVIQLESSFKDYSRSAILLLFINIGKNSQIILHDRVVTPLSESTNFFNSYCVTSIHEGSKLEVIHEEDFNDSNIHIRNIEYNQARDSGLSLYFFNLGGYKGKTFLETNLNSRGAVAVQKGVAVGIKKEIQDIEFSLNHLESHTESNLMFKTVMKDKSHHIFTGNLNIPRTSVHVTASQLNNNLIINKTARAESMPKLEVFADDVKCSHGATMSEIDEEQLFYLQSRGFSPIDARHLIVEGFISEILDGINSESLSQSLKDKFLSKIGI